MTASRRALIIVGVLVAVALGLPWDGAVREASAQISVTSANPPTGEQGTLNLPVVITGKGFKNGAKAKFYRSHITPPDTGGINVKSTQFVSSTQLVATIDIADTAALSAFDIQVANTDGRTGKGTELFSVTAKKVDSCTLPDPVPTLSEFMSDAPGYPGYLDSTFGGGTGRVIGPRYVEHGYLASSAIAVDAEDRVVAVGRWQDTCHPSSISAMSVVRYLRDGSPDPDFGSGGTGLVTLPFTGGGLGHTVLVQPDGQLVVVGRAKPSKSSNYLPVVVRLNEDGSLDSGFGSGGWTVVSPGGKAPSGEFDGATLQSDGKIVAVGRAGTYGLGFIARLNANGTVDTSFNRTGQYTDAATAMYNAVTTQIVEGSERIVVGGSAKDSAKHYIGCLWRFTESGALDTSFGGTGVLTLSLHTDDGVHWFENGFQDLMIDTSGVIVTAGYKNVMTPPDTASYSQVVLTRHLPSGELDATFGDEQTGVVVVAPERERNYVSAMAIQSDGRIVVAGYSADNSVDGSQRDGVAAVWRFDASGGVDATFGQNGVAADAITTGTRIVYWKGIALQADGRIVCGGYAIIEGDPIVTYGILGRFWQ